MPALSIDQLLSAVPIDQARQVMINLFKGLGFKGVASWQDGSLPRSLGIEAPAALMSDISQSIRNIAAGGYNDTAEKGWLTLLADSHFDNRRYDPVRTQGLVELASTGGSTPPYTVAAGYMVVVHTPTGRTFRNLAPVTTVPGSSVFAEVIADVAGAQSVLVNTLNTLQTPLAGVSVNNPGTDGEWITVVGADEEEDPRLRTRNRTKWATRAYPTPGAAYEYWALEADPAITRAQVNGQNPAGPGSVRIYIAGPGGTLPGSLGTKVEQYIEGTLVGGDGIVRRPISAIVSCLPAEDLPVAVTGTVYVAAAYVASAPSSVELALSKLFASLRIGGVPLEDGPTYGTLFSSGLYGVVMPVPGVVNATLTLIVGGVPYAIGENPGMDIGQVAVLTTALTYVQV